MAAPEAAKAYLAALAARSSSPHQGINARANSTSSSSSSSSPATTTAGGDDSSSLYTGASSISSFSDASSYTTSSSISSAATSLASSLPSPSSLLKRKRQNTNTNGNVILGRKRGLSESLASLTHPDNADKKIIYSNDYHVPITESEARLFFSKHPPKNANKILPTRHFDKDPFYVPEELKNDPTATLHAEFGYSNEKYEYKSQYRQSTGVGGEEIEEPSHFIYLTTYISYLLLIVIGHLRDFIGKRTHRKSYQHLMPYNVSLAAAKEELHTLEMPSELTYDTHLSASTPTGLRRSQ